ncbi:MAG TPA: NAD-dependent epimerase/dehydratase family protein [Candidatus Limnocylindrales bacterium]|nr:NAD-dependent epimerase/dehydratase family protein [Candidatus Limnocylindrales bacterium]
MSAKRDGACLESPDWPAGKRIVVTGGAGFLGRAVVSALAVRGCREITIPRHAQCDLSRRADILHLLNHTQPDAIVHLAGTVDNPARRADAAESFRNNVLMTTQLMDAACRHGVGKMVCIGSASSYPATANVPLREENLFNGLPEESRAAHGIAKRLPLIQAQAYRRQYGFRCIFLIPTNFYGPGDNFDAETSYVIPSLIRRFVEAAESRAAEVTLGGSGACTRDFLHVEDCAEGIVRALERYDKPEAANLGSGIETRIDEMASKIARLAGYAGRVSWDHARADGPSRRLLDTARARREFGFEPRWRLDDGLRETLAWFRSERERTASESQAVASGSRA